MSISLIYARYTTLLSLACLLASGCSRGINGNTDEFDIGEILYIVIFFVFGAWIFKNGMKSVNLGWVIFKKKKKEGLNETNRKFSNEYYNWQSRKILMVGVIVVVLWILGQLIL